jgi:CHASE2 domain-containing sensor protein
VKLPFLKQGSITVKRYLARSLLALITTVGVLGHIVGFYVIPYIDQIEDILYDSRVRLSAPGGVDDRIVIVAIDEASLQEHGHWPFTREKFAAMMNNLSAYGVAVVGFDVLFAERDESADVDILRALAEQDGDRDFVQKLEAFEPMMDRDRMFADAMQSIPTVLGFYFDSNPEKAFETGVLPYAAFEFHESMADSIFLPRGEGYVSTLPVLMDSAYSAGFINNPLIDADGVVRRTPLLHEYRFSVYEALSQGVASTYLNDITLPIFVDASSWMGDYPPLEGLELAGRPIPIDPQGAVLVPYRGPAGSFPYVSIGDVISGRVEDPSIFEGRIALVGATAPGMQDLRTTPFGSIYPGVEIHANVTAGILDGSFRWEPAYTAAAEMMAVTAFGLLTAFLLPVLTPIVSTLVTLAITALALGVNYYMWTVELHVLPLAMTLYTLFAIYTINMLFGYLFETRSRQHMDGLFGQYVPPDLVREEPRPGALFAGLPETRTLGFVHRHSQFHFHLGGPGRGRAVRTDGRIPHAHDAHRAREQGHHRQVHRRRGHGVLGCPDSLRRPFRPGGGCRPGHAGSPQRPEQRLQKTRLARNPYRRGCEYRHDERGQHGFILPPRLHRAGRRGEPRFAPGRHYQGLRRRFHRWRDHREAGRALCFPRTGPCAGEGQGKTRHHPGADWPGRRSGQETDEEPCSVRTVSPALPRSEMAHSVKRTGRIA